MSIDGCDVNKNFRKNKCGELWASADFRKIVMKSNTWYFPQLLM
jgi:hypothetical protein